MGILCPDMFIERVYDLDVAELKARGIKALIFDLDNTLVEWGSCDVPEGLEEWIKGLKAQGFKMAILSNNRKARVAAVADKLGMPAVSGFVKPWAYGFRKALQLLGTEPRETAVVGDQVFTDVLGGNRLGLFTVLVKPVSESEFVTTRIVRWLERIVLRRIVTGGPK